MSGEKTDSGSPVSWDEALLLQHLADSLSTSLAMGGMNLHPKRVRRQLEANDNCRPLLEKWAGLSADQRLEAYQQLLHFAPDACQEPLAGCVRCGQCCRRASPALHEQDLPLVRAEKIPLRHLVTYRRGERLRAMIGDDVEILRQERIKLKEKDSSGECVFFDPGSELCTIYPHRPWECRAQACWDPALALELQKRPYLTRADVIPELPTLQQLLDEHDRRCQPQALEEAFSRLLEGADEQAARQAVEVVAFDDHFRHFVAERFGLERETLDFFFGRSFAAQVGRFGFQIVTRADDTRVLEPRAG